MKYIHYTEDDFIADEYFQKWILDPDPSTIHFWESWISENPVKKDLVKNASRFVRMMDFDTNDELSSAEVDAMWQNIVQKKDRNKTKSFNLKKFVHTNKDYTSWFAAACVVLVVFVLGVGRFWNSNTIEKTPQVSESVILLKLGDGKVQVLNESATETITDSEGEKIVSQKKNLLIYDAEAGKEPDIRYNELVVPYSKKFQLMLADGTHVFLNSGSKLRYPTGFENGTARTVFLDGEAYFSVKKDNSSPFIVITEHMYTEVYGTEFNVSSYKNENNTSTVLVEGSVGVYGLGGKETEKLRKMVPGERAVILHGEILVDTVNVKKHVAWVEGKLFFADDKFELILKELERHFNVVFENELEELNGKHFTGTFTDESIQQILRIFQEHTPFRYTINEGTITIHEKV